MTSSTVLKEVFAAARPAMQLWLDTTKNLNATFTRAWRDGSIDDLWDVFRNEYPDLYLTYYFRARGMGDIKIGKTNHIRTRFLTAYTFASRGLDMIACYPSDRGHEVELKREFEHLNLSGEWYRPGRELLTHLRLIGVDVDAFTNTVPAHFMRKRPELMS